MKRMLTRHVYSFRVFRDFVANPQIPGLRSETVRAGLRPPA
jgi:hypothetical protein